MFRQISSLVVTGPCFLVMSLALSSCGSLDRVPFINKAGVLGEMSMRFFSGDDETDAEAVSVEQVNLAGAFATGDRVEMSVYEGVRSARRLARADAVVDESGEIEFGRIGAIVVAGRTPGEVERMVQSAALRSERGLGVHFTTHLESWNGHPVVEVRGKVAHPGLLVLPPAGASPASVIGMAGGFAGSGAVSRVVLVSKGRERPVLVGSRNFTASELRAGDRVVVE